jgi:hypothetical protein
MMLVSKKEERKLKRLIIEEFLLTMDLALIMFWLIYLGFVAA